MYGYTFLGEDVSIIYDVDMSSMVTVKTGGRARAVAYPKNVFQLQKILYSLRQKGEKYFVLGNGSNTLVSDEGYSGIVIKIGGYFGRISLCKDEVSLSVGAGASCAAVSAFALKNSLAGAEFLCAIPGSVGGATVINAGCYGYCMADVVTSVYAVTADGKKTYTKQKICYGYRDSVFCRNDDVVAKVKITLKKGDAAAISGLMQKIKETKRASQPLDYPSFGSVFKSCGGKSAALLIDAAGLKGLTVGGARISDKHAGFFINTGKATTEDFLTLIDVAGNKIREKNGLILQPEVKYLGDTDDLGRLSYTHIF